MSAKVEINGKTAVILSGRDALALVRSSVSIFRRLCEGPLRQGDYYDDEVGVTARDIMDAAREYNMSNQVSISSTPVPSSAVSLEREWITIAQASRLYGRDVRTISRWCRLHMVAARKDGKIWLVKAGQPSPTSFANKNVA